MLYLQFAQERKGWTQAELARMAGTTQACVSAWERGIRLPSMRNLVRLGKIFGVADATILLRRLGGAGMHVVRPFIRTKKGGKGR
jgi:transcriptional regulator with XRE-family HTH domain